MMRDLPEIAEPFTLLLSVRVLMKQIPLSAHELGEHQHTRTRTVYSCSLNQQLMRCPRIIDPNSRPPVICQYSFPLSR
jgi:hypothetical protein